MPFPQNMIKVTYEFGWSITQEIQVTGFWCRVVQGNGLSQFGDWDEIIQKVADRAVSAWSNQMSAGLYSLGVKGRRAIAYHYDQAHNEVLDRAETAFVGDDVWTGAASGSMPPQLTVAASLYAYDPATFVVNRENKRGRMYLPTPSNQIVDGTGMMTAGTVGTFADDVRDFFNEFTGDLELDSTGVDQADYARPYIVSGALNDAFPVTDVRVGSVIDTQRRRRNQLTEEYVSRSINA